MSVNKSFDIKRNTKIINDYLIEQSLLPNQLHITCNKLNKINQIYYQLTELKQQNNLINYYEIIELYNMLVHKCNKFKNLNCYSLENTTDLYPINISIFSNLIHLKLERCPPSTIIDFHLIRGTIQTIEILNSGIMSLSKIFINDLLNHKQYRRLVLNRLPSLLSVNNTSNDINMKEIKSLYDYKSLISLKLINCGLINIDSSFHFFPNIRYMDLNNNNVQFIIHLSSNISLNQLNFSYNKIQICSNLFLTVGNIKYLNLSYNQIISLDGLNKLYSLISLNLSNNLIDDFSEIQYLTNLPNLESVILLDNPISRHVSTNATEGNNNNNINSEYRMKVYEIFITSGNILGSHRSIPRLDGIEITNKELKSFRKVMFRALEEDQRELTVQSSNYIEENDPVETTSSLSPDNDLNDEVIDVLNSSFHSSNYRPSNSYKQSSSRGSSINSATLQHINNPNDSSCNPYLLSHWHAIRNNNNIHRNIIKIYENEDESMTIYPTIAETKIIIQKLKKLSEIENESKFLFNKLINELKFINENSHINSFIDQMPYDRDSLTDSNISNDVVDPVDTYSYYGLDEYKRCNVILNLELYFREQVFRNELTEYDSPYIKLSNDNINESIKLIDPLNSLEKFITLYYEKIITLPNDLTNKMKLYNKSVNVKSLGIENNEELIILALTTTKVYFLTFLDNNINNSCFEDIPIPTLIISYDITTLTEIVIYFGFQRILLTFQSSNEITNNYMVITRDKSKMYPIITQLPQLVKLAKSNISNNLINLNIINQDIQLNNFINSYIKSQYNNNYDNDIIFYQMLYQYSKSNNKSNSKSNTNKSNLTMGSIINTRSIIITPSLILLCYENLFCKDIDITICDSCLIKDIVNIVIDTNNNLRNRYIVTFYMKSNSTIFNKQRKWVLIADSMNIINRLVDECNRLIKSYKNVNV